MTFALTREHLKLNINEIFTKHLHLNIQLPSNNKHLLMQ